MWRPFCETPRASRAFSTSSKRTISKPALRELMAAIKNGHGVKKNQKRMPDSASLVRMLRDFAQKDSASKIGSSDSPTSASFSSSRSSQPSPSMEKQGRRESDDLFRKGKSKNINHNISDSSSSGSNSSNMRNNANNIPHDNASTNNSKKSVNGVSNSHNDNYPNSKNSEKTRRSIGKNENQVLQERLEASMKKFQEDVRQQEKKLKASLQQQFPHKKHGSKQQPRQQREQQQSQQSQQQQQRPTQKIVHSIHQAQNKLSPSQQPVVPSHQQQKKKSKNLLQILLHGKKEPQERQEAVDRQSSSSRNNRSSSNGSNSSSSSNKISNREQSVRSSSQDTSQQQLGSSIPHANPPYKPSRSSSSTRASSSKSVSFSETDVVWRYAPPEKAPATSTSGSTSSISADDVIIDKVLGANISSLSHPSSPSPSSHSSHSISEENATSHSGRIVPTRKDLAHPLDTEKTTRETLTDEEAPSEEEILREQRAHRKEEEAFSALHDQWTQKQRVPLTKRSVARETILRYQRSDLLSLEPIKMEVMSTPPSDAINQLATGLRGVLDRRGVHIVKNAMQGEPAYQGTISEEFLNIVQPDAIDTSAIAPFVTSSRDINLLKAAQDAKSSFMGSTSSTTGLLAQIIQLLLAHRPFNMDSFSDDFENLPRTFTQATRKATCVVLRRRGKIMGIDSPPKYNPPSNKILIELGKSLERMFTMEPEHFKNVMVKSSRKGVSKGRKIPTEPAMCVKINSLMVRAQLDCQDIVTGGGVFDLKTRAVLPIRLDCKNHTRYTGYNITAYNGLLYSFEREFFDMVRSTMIKYNLQARIGQMAGIMVAYHNTQKIFGFEYVPQTVMDEHLYGSTMMGKLIFNIATKLLDVGLNQILDILGSVDSQQIRLIAHAMKGQKFVDFFTEVIPENAYADHPDSVVREHYAPYGVDLLGTVELRARLQALGLDDKGVRPALVARLESALHAPIEADIPSLEFFEEQIIAGRVRHFRLHIYLAQKGAIIESLHAMTFSHLEEQDPQKFAELNGVQIRYQFESMKDVMSPNNSAKRFWNCVRDSTDDNDDEARSAVAAEIPMNG